MSAEKFNKTYEVSAINNKSFREYQKGELFGVIVHQTKKAVCIRIISAASGVLGVAQWVPKSCIDIKNTYNAVFDCEHCKSTVIQNMPYMV